MKLVSVNCGLPREVVWHGRTITTGIFKEPVNGRVALRKLNLDGDRQADLSVHGGVAKAVYCYQLCHYESWNAELPGRELSAGSFGENFTIDGPTEGSIRIGDTFTVGSSVVTVTQPRLPCYKLGVKFQSDDMVKRFLESRRTGFYLSVAREGEVGAGDEMRLIESEPVSVSVADITHLYTAKQYNSEDMDLLQRALTTASLPDSWKERLRQGLQQRAGA